MTNERLNERYWIWITAVENIPPREGRAVTVAGRTLAIFNLGNRFVAVDNKCPHKGGPLADGIVSGDTVVCPLHGWRIDLQGGQVKRPADITHCVERYPTMVDDGIIVVGLPASSTKEAGEAA
jgi:nitrite reductase (NADH) small subunit